MRIKRFLVLTLLLTAVTGVSSAAWAVTSPEPQSGGRFFPGKGTQAAAEFPYEPAAYPESYARTETGSFERDYYAKGLKLGIVNVRPSIGYTGEYDSNIFLSEDNAKGDYINRLLAGIDADVPMQGGKYLLTGGIQNRSEWFADHHRENHSDWQYQLGGEANFSAFSVAVHEDFRDTSSRSGGELTERVKRYENRLGGLLTVPFGQFFSETEVSDFIVHFRDNDAFKQSDRHEFSIYPRLGMNIGSKTQALLEYGLTNISFSKQDDRDGRAHQASAGMRGFLGKGNLMSYQAWGGWQFRHYDNGSLDAFNGFIAHGEIIYRPSQVGQFILRALRRPEESTETGQTFYTRNEMSLRYKRQVAKQWFVNAQGAAGFNHYSNSRLDFLWEPGVGLEYVLPGNILALFTEYKFSARHSDAGGRDYYRHIANFGIRAEV